MADGLTRSCVNRAITSSSAMTCGSDSHHTSVSTNNDSRSILVSCISLGSFRGVSCDFVSVVWGCASSFGRSPKWEISFVSFVRASGRGEAACVRERDHASLRWPSDSRISLLSFFSFVFAYGTLGFALFLLIFLIVCCNVKTAGAGDLAHEFSKNIWSLVAV